MKLINPDMVISYNYHLKLPREIISYPRMGCINLHVGYLPMNRGAYPNFFSHLEGTPSGVTIHLMDEGIDTGPVIVQKLVLFTKEENTLQLTYDKLQDEVKKLFIESWPIIKTNGYPVYSQNSKFATEHRKKDLPKNVNWDLDPRYCFNMID